MVHLTDGIGSNPLVDMFPAGRTGSETTSIQTSGQDEEDDDEATTKKLRSVLSKLKSRRAISDENAAKMENPVFRPGTSYMSYRSEDDLPETAKAFYESAAKLAGLSLATLIRVVKLTENRFQNLEEQDARGPGGGSGPEEEEEGFKEDLMDIDVDD